MDRRHGLGNTSHAVRVYVMCALYANCMHGRIYQTNGRFYLTPDIFYSSISVSHNFSWLSPYRTSCVGFVIPHSYSSVFVLCVSGSILTGMIIKLMTFEADVLTCKWHTIIKWQTNFMAQCRRIKARLPLLPRSHFAVSFHRNGMTCTATFTTRSPYLRCNTLKDPLNPSPNNHRTAQNPQIFMFDLLSAERGLTRPDNFLQYCFCQTSPQETYIDVFTAFVHISMANSAERRNPRRQ